MKVIEVDTDQLSVSPELIRSGSAKSFEERLKSSIEEMGLAEPLKVAPDPAGGYLVIDGALRLNAIREIRAEDPARFVRVPAYLLDYNRRYEIRFQSDIYQDLLPSQLATLVEHLHHTEHVRKLDIARYIGVSPATLRNYTGLWRLLERGGLSARIVELMDLDVLPSSNPYAWLRLTDKGVALALRERFANGEDPHDWVSQSVDAARAGIAERYPVKYVEDVTASLPDDCYHAGQEIREVKRELGLRRAEKPAARRADVATQRRLASISQASTVPVLASAAQSLGEYLS